MNVPDVEFPPLPKALETAYTPHRVARPHRVIPIRNVNSIRIIKNPTRNGIVIYPEFEIDDGWFTIQINNRPLIFKVHKSSIFGIAMGDINGKAKKLMKELYDWLEDWIKLERNNIKLEDPFEKKDEKSNSVKDNKKAEKKQVQAEQQKKKEEEDKAKWAKAKAAILAANKPSEPTT